RLGDWTVDPGSRSLTDGTRHRRLSPRACRLLCTLAAEPLVPIGRDALMDAIWPAVIVGDESLTQAVTELRRALGAEGREIVETIPRMGYRLTRPVFETAAAPAAPLQDAFDLQAYQLCMEARASMARGGGNVVVTCAALTRDAAARAPDFAFARAENAVMLSYGWLYQRRDVDAAYEALQEAEAAVALRPDLADTHTAQAFALAAADRPGEAIAALESAMRRDLTNADAHFLGARIMFALSRYRMAAALAERAAEMWPEDYWALYFAARAAAAIDPDRARRNATLGLCRVEAHLAVDPANPRARNLRGPLLAALGRRTEARDAIEGQRDSGSTLRIYDAIGLATLGDEAGALDVIGSLAERGWSHRDWLTAEPAFATLQGQPRFRDALCAMTAP
ncbi:MAG: winged helix-turn-helix domain-containing protein, partial [Pseudomonadota bacterium]